MSTNGLISKTLFGILAYGFLHFASGQTAAQNTTQSTTQTSAQNTTQSGNVFNNTIKSISNAIDKIPAVLPPDVAFINAVKANNVDAVKRALALKNEISPNTKDTVFPHHSALQFACWENAVNVMPLLLADARVNVEQLNAASENALMICSLKGYLPMTLQLLEKGAYPNKEGWTPLHYAASANHGEVIKVLLDNSAYIDAESPEKMTPMMMAAQSGYTSVIKLLLDEGADMTLKNKYGEDVIAVADRYKQKEIAEGLRARVAKLKERDAKKPWLR